MKESIRVTVCSLLLCICCLLGSNLSAQWHFPVIGGTLPNAAVNLGNNCFELTSAANSRGVVWDSVQIDLSQPFDITLSINQQPWGADGLALVLQGAGLGANGAGANALGFGNSIPASVGYSAIAPSIAFEVDTWDNSLAGVADIAQDHVAIHANGNMAATIGAPVSAIAGGTDVTDGFCHRFRVVWQPGVNNIRIFFDGNPVPRINLNYNMVGLIFGGNPMVWWGVTGGSGGAAMTQRVCVGASFANVGPDATICAGTTLQLNGSGGTNYAWQPGAPILTNAALQNPVFGPTAAGNFVVSAQVTNAALCTDRDTTLITVAPLPVANAGANQNLCLGDSVQLGSPALPNLLYAWRPGAGLSDSLVAQPWATGLAVGTVNYSLIVRDPTTTAGCADSALVSITVVDTPQVALVAVNDTLCLGVSSTLTAIPSAGIPPYSYAWSNGAITGNQLVTPNATTTYLATITDASSCTTVGNVTVTVNDTPTVALAAAPDSICAGGTSQLSVGAVGGTPAYTYLWNTGSTATPITVAPLATTTYTVTATDALGCQSSGNISVTVNVSDSLDIVTPDTLVCTGSTILVQGTFSTPGINTWNWSPAFGLGSPTNPNTSITPTATTTYYLSGSNSNTGCGYTDSIRIEFVALTAPLVNLGADTALCTGSTLVLNAGNPGFSYVWSNGDTMQQSGFGTSGWISVLVFDTLGCGYIAQDSLLLTLQPLPAPQLGADTTICTGDSLLLQAGNFSGGYLWSDGSNANSFWATQSGLYWVEVKDSLNCTGSDSLVLTLQPNPVVAFDTLAPQYCSLDAAVMLIGTPAGGVFTGTTGANGIFDPAIAGAGNHTVQYQFTDAFGCSDSISQSTTVFPPPSAALAGPDLQGEAQITLQAQAASVGFGSWLTGNFTGSIDDAGDPNATVTFDSSGTYLLIWTVKNPPCPANSDSVWITFEGIHIPTGFSPNADGVNDVYFIRGLGGYPGTKLMIFNRWGNQVWGSEDYQNDWNGDNADAQPLVDDTYYAVIEYGGKRLQTYVVLKRQ
ncbi:MAG: gliding motility-associated C-terminal domain-containing protein [Bacteroidetes bacterium]|nr:gliding motility-associated C-terminal domain-containing protein [Bacteroidota bacterium]